MASRADRRRRERPPRGFALAIALGAVVLIAFTAFVLTLAEDAVRREAQGRVRTTAELGARLAGEQALRFQEVIGAYALRLRDVEPPRRARLRPGDARRAREVLDALLRDVHGTSAAILTDPLGRVVAASPARHPAGADLSGREWYRGVTRTHRPYVSLAYRSVTAPGHPRTTTVALPVRAPGGRTIGILAVSETRRVQAMTDALGAQLDAELVVTDQAGTVVGRTGHPSAELRSRARDPLVVAALRGRSGVDERQVEGEHTVSGYAPVSPSGWTVTANVPADDAFSGIPRLRIALLAASGIVVFVLLWLVPLLVSRLFRARSALDISQAFQSDLLPRVLPQGVRTHYVASEKRMLLGGDFLDAVETPDGSLAVCVGDVCGHGPRAAALGATLRAGWRTLASMGNPVDRMELLDRLVESQRPDDDLFATVACGVVSPDRSRLQIALAGHPPPVFVDEHGAVMAIDGVRGPALGLGAGPMGAWPISERTLHGAWTLALYTDGLIESRRDERSPRLGLDGLIGLMRAAWIGEALDADALLRGVAAQAGRRGSDDDVALVLVDGTRVRPVTTERLRYSEAG